MLVGAVLPGKDGAEYAVPQLDCFSEGGGFFLSGKDNIVRQTSEGGAYEHTIDDYLEEFCIPFAEVCQLVSPQDALNLILTRRNGDRGRNRVQAAKEIAAMVPHHLKVQEFLAKDSIHLDWDAYHAEQAWLWQKIQFTGVLIEIQNGRLYLGDGDGYHRATDYEAIQNGAEEGDELERYDGEESHRYQLRSYDVADEHGIRKAVQMAIRTALQEQKQWTVPCDEKYWRRYCRVSEMLETRYKKPKRDR